MTPAIVLSADTMGLAVIRSLGTRGVPITAVYYHARDIAYVSKYVTNSVCGPHPGRNEKEFIELLLSLVGSQRGGLLIPTDDATVIAVSRNKDLLEQHYTVACADWGIARQFIDKKYTYELASSVGVATPRTMAPESEADLKDWSNRVGFPIIVKPRESHRYAERFSRKCTRAGNFDQLIAAYDEATGANIEVVVQELIPGDDAHNVNYNSYHVGGEPLAEFTSKKLRLSPPMFGLPRVVVSEHIPEVLEPARKFLRALGYYGYCCTEFKRDPRDGVYKLMEVNGRHNRSGLLAIRCGIDFPWLEYEFLTKGIVPNQQGSVEGVYWIDELRDAFDWIRYRDSEKNSLGEYLRPYLGKHIFTSLDFTDPKPFFKRFLNSLRARAPELGGKP